MRFTPSGTLRLRVVAAAIEMFLGLAIYAIPRESSAPAYDPVRPYLLHLSAALVAGGVVLLMAARYPLLPWVQRCLPMVAAVPLGMLAWGQAQTAVWSGTAFYALLAGALLAAPWLPHDRGEGTGSGLDVFEVTTALILASFGSLMLLQPRAFAIPAYAGRLTRARPGSLLSP